MVFTKYSLSFFLCRIYALMGLVLISACSVLPRETADEVIEPSVPQAVLPQQTDSDQFTLLPNPYLLQSTDISTAAQTQYAQALDLMKQEQWQASQKVLLNLIQEDPTLSGPYVNLALIHWQQKNIDQAKQNLHDAIKANPKNIDAYTILAFIQRERGEFDDAEQSHLKALAIWPHSPESHRNLGILYDLYMGRFEDAIKHYEIYQKVSPQPSKKVKGWVIDLKRRMAKTQR